LPQDFFYNSLALLSDAGHNLSDVASLGLSLFAFKLAKSKSTERFTYGYHKGTILASLANAVILLIAVGSIGWEAIQRFMQPEETQG
jgi:cobalt-zinc-cadmium efflux system protein